jgi:hypothetical protein
MLLTRKQFKEFATKNWPNIGVSATSPLWIPEVDLGEECQYFLFIPVMQRWNKNDFWEWSDKLLIGKTRCFMRGDSGEVWGFTNEDDISMFLLKWL